MNTPDICHNWSSQYRHTPKILDMHLGYLIWVLQNFRTNLVQNSKILSGIGTHPLGDFRGSSHRYKIVPTQHVIYAEDPMSGPPTVPR
jgi:hypothetical protein